MTRNPVKIVLALGVLALAGILALYVDNTTLPIGEKPRQFKDLGGKFDLDSINGSVELDAYKDNVVVLYFGYLNCAEVCPSSMGVMSASFKYLPENVYDKTQGFFVSVDPERDDLTSLNDFAQYFDKRILGLTGSKEEIQTITDQYGVYIDLVDMSSSELAYTVDHASRFYIIDPDGQLVDSLSHSTTPIELAARIERALEEYNATTGNAS
ncbi:SCO family protein [Vibrio sp. S9_S30]|uniref:SCO family protein n=1 Tax=Vibrio sp. S9_S30 TaxID=2720226 RepID=UPI00167FED88|nr:SCO family protein [Vibrio sp. S9_S30]MBD1556471.1 SCO family protein [Vibrio sp. S9_S30]